MTFDFNEYCLALTQALCDPFFLELVELREGVHKNGGSFGVNLLLQRRNEKGSPSGRYRPGAVVL